MASPAEWCSLFIWILLHCCGCWAVVLYRNTLSHPNILFSLKQWQPKLSACKLVWLYEMFWPKGWWQTVTVTASSWVSSSPQFSQASFPPRLCFGSRCLPVSCTAVSVCLRRTRLRIVYQQQSGLAHVSVGQWCVHQEIFVQRRRTEYFSLFC